MTLTLLFAVVSVLGGSYQLKKKRMESGFALTAGGCLAIAAHDAMITAPSVKDTVAAFVFGACGFLCLVGSIVVYVRRP
jgi:hypothetical protein